MIDDFHFNITNLTHSEIRARLRLRGLFFDNIVTRGKPDYKVPHCCSVHCEEIFAYSGKNPGYCVCHFGRGLKTSPKGVPYGQSKLQ